MTRPRRKGEGRAEAAARGVVVRAGAGRAALAFSALVLLAGSCGGPRPPSGLHSPLPAGPVVPVASPPATPPPRPTPLPPLPPAAARAIAIAEDQRRYGDGALKRFLSDSSSAVRARAALAVGRLQDSTAVPDLLRLLEDSALAVRHEAIFALGQIGHRAARVSLEGKLADPDPETVELAVEALGKLGDRAATGAVAAQLGSASPRARGEAAVALWRLADSTALPVLLAARNDPELEVRWRVLYALEKIVDPQQIVLVGALHLSDPQWAVRAQAARTIGRQRSTRGTAYLIGALRDGEIPVVVNAIRALQQIADSNTYIVAEALTRSLAHPDPYVRVTAATALGERFAWVGSDSAGRAAVSDSLRAHLADRDAATRGACARALLRQGPAAERAPVLKRFAADTSPVARAAVIAAWPAGEPGPLLERLERGRPLFERMRAADRLGELRERAAVAPLRAGLSDTAALFVAACAGALAAMRDTASVPALARAFRERARDADADARVAIRDALRALAGRAYADSLERHHPPGDAPPAAYPPDFAEPLAVRGAVLHTTAGDIEWTFYVDQAPQTVKNFVRLATAGYFDGLMVHRVVPNFVIQDGDPTGTGSGGPGYAIRCEYNRLRYDPYMVGMALSGKDTGGSQWFITHSAQPHLNGRYTIFARVTRGWEAVWRLVQGDQVRKVEILR